MLAALAIFGLTYLAVAAGRFPGLSVDRPAAASLLTVGLALQLLFRRELPRRPLGGAAPASPPRDRRLLAKALVATGLALAGFLAGPAWRR